MPAYDFRLIVAGKSQFSDAEADALYEAGCDDGTIASSCGIAYVCFAREAESLGDAVGSAIKDVERAGFTVARVEVEPTTGA